MRRVKIVSNGTVHGTKVIDEKTAELIRGVQSVTWSVDIEENVAEATIELAGLPVELSAEVKETSLAEETSTSRITRTAARSLRWIGPGGGENESSDERQEAGIYPGQTTIEAIRSRSASARPARWR